MKYSETKKFDCLINLALLDCGNKDYEMFMAIDDSKVIVDNSLNKRIFKLIRRKERENKRIKAKKFAVKVILVAMLIMSVLFMTIMAVKPIRNAIWKTVVRWHENYISVKYEKDTEKEQITESENETPSESVITPPTVIEEIRKPTYIVEGSQEISFSNSTMAVSEYYIGEDLVYMFTQYLLNESEKYFDSESASISNVEINGHTATLFTYSDMTEMDMIWNDGEYIYMLSNYALDKEKMINIARSVK